MKIDDLWDGLENVKDTLNILYETVDMAGFAFQQGVKEDRVGPVITGVGNGIQQAKEQVEELIEEAINLRQAIKQL